ncbi:MAG: transglycosylase domain-containing protein [Acidimicrobiaceae bacterium]|nr:transglycosylase domain-containing protein [Acidimicrobiaceae bacterium]
MRHIRFMAFPNQTSRLRTFLASFGFTAFLLAGAACSYEVPNFTFDVQDLETPQTTHIYDRNGKIITQLHSEQSRTDIDNIDLVPPLVRNAVIAIEDERFYNHAGIDLKAILRAARSNASSGTISQGGSTITQQYVGNVFLDRRDQTVTRKIQEIFMALRFEQNFSKDFILLHYLNWVYFGNGAYGIEAAAREYFGAPNCESPALSSDGTPAARLSKVCLKVSELTIEQAALLAGLIQRPGALDPYRHPEDAVKRRNLVMKRMLVNDLITAEEYANAVKQPLVLVEDVPILEKEYPAAYFVEDTKQWFLDNPRFGSTRERRTELLFEGGLDIHTTIDLNLQADAEAAVAAILPDTGQNPDAAAVVLGMSGNEEGHILTMIGGRDFFRQDTSDKDAKVNLATGKGRPAGSAMKTMALATALTLGMPISTAYDAPNELVIDRPDLCGPKPWTVRGGRGSTKEMPVDVNLTTATQSSINTVYAQLIVDIGPQKFVEMAEKLGADEHSISPVCAAVLGTEDVNTLELATMYSTIGRSGWRVDPVMVTKILRPDGTTLYQHEDKATSVLAPSIANLITSVLQGAITNGTGRKAAIDRPAAGKTGTAQNYVDASFVGYTPQRAAAVWVGYSNAQIPMVPPKTDIRVSGGSYPAMIWSEIMLAAHKGILATDFPDPPPLSLTTPTTIPSELVAVEIPDFAGNLWDENVLTAELAVLDLKLDYVEIETAEFTEGTIIGQIPAARSLQPSGTTVILEVAVEPEIPAIITAPDVVGLSAGEARQLLAAAGLPVDEILEPQFIDGVIAGGLNSVWRQSPSAGATLTPGQVVAIWINPDFRDLDITHLIEGS